MKRKLPVDDTLKMLLRALRLPAFGAYFAELAQRGQKENWSYEQYLHALIEVELAERTQRRVLRDLKRSNLPEDKTLATLKLSRLPAAIRRQVPTLCEGGFVDRAENVLSFGLPGRGKTHLCCAIGHELVRKGKRVLFIPAYQLVQRLLCAKRDLSLEQQLRRLDAFDVVIVDDIGYIQQNRDEMEVLFTFLSARYERRSVMITSNLVGIPPVQLTLRMGQTGPEGVSDEATKFQRLVQSGGREAGQRAWSKRGQGSQGAGHQRVSVAALD